MTTPEVAQRLAVTERMVASWVERGYINKPGGGHGAKREWTLQEFQTLKLLPGLTSILRPEALLLWLESHVTPHNA